MKTLKEVSIEIAYKYHAGQTRWDKKIPYITHPIAVAKIVDNLYDAEYGISNGTYKDIVIAIAILHDTIEDTELSLQKLEEIFRQELNQKETLTFDVRAVLDGVADITKNPNKDDETYLQYILRVKSNENSRLVKIADITHNLSDLKHGSMKDKYLLAKYILEQY